jgi:hypothetical protein
VAEGTVAISSSPPPVGVTGGVASLKKLPPAFVDFHTSGVPGEVAYMQLNESSASPGSASLVELGRAMFVAKVAGPGGAGGA